MLEEMCGHEELRDASSSGAGHLASLCLFLLAVEENTVSAQHLQGIKSEFCHTLTLLSAESLSTMFKAPYLYVILCFIGIFITPNA